MVDKHLRKRPRALSLMLGGILSTGCSVVTPSREVGVIEDSTSRDSSSGDSIASTSTVDSTKLAVEDPVVLYTCSVHDVVRLLDPDGRCPVCLGRLTPLLGAEK